METVTLRAHFEGKHILLDEPFELEPNTELIVTGGAARFRRGTRRLDAPCVRELGAGLRR